MEGKERIIFNFYCFSPFFLKKVERGSKITLIFFVKDGRGEKMV